MTPDARLVPWLWGSHGRPEFAEGYLVNFAFFLVNAIALLKTMYFVYIDSWILYNFFEHIQTISWFMLWNLCPIRENP